MRCSRVTVLPALLLGVLLSGLLTGCTSVPQGLSRACLEVQGMVDRDPGSQGYAERRTQALALVDQYLAGQNLEGGWDDLATTLRDSLTSADQEAGLAQAEDACEDPQAD